MMRPPVVVAVVLSLLLFTYFLGKHMPEHYDEVFSQWAYFTDTTILGQFQIGKGEKWEHQMAPKRCIQSR